MLSSFLTNLLMVMPLSRVKLEMEFRTWGRGGGEHHRNWQYYIEQPIVMSYRQSESPPTLTLNPIPMHLDGMGLWMGTMCMLPTYHCQSHRQHKQQSEVCTIHTSIYHASIRATHSKAITKTIHNINLCGAHKHKATSLFYSIGRCGDCAMNVCHDTSHSCVSC